MKFCFPRNPNNPTAIIQTGSQHTNGFEVGLTGNITPKWNVSGGYAYQNAFITSATATAIAGKRAGINSRLRDETD